MLTPIAKGVPFHLLSSSLKLKAHSLGALIFTYQKNEIS